MTPGRLLRGSSDTLPSVPVLKDKHVWNLEHTLAAIIAQGVRRLREMDHGYPGNGDADTPEKWRAILDEMADGFQQYAESEYHGFDADYDKLNRSLDLLRVWFPHLWD